MTTGCPPVTASPQSVWTTTALSLCKTAGSSAAPTLPKRARRKEARTVSLEDSAENPEPHTTTVSPPSADPAAGATNDNIGAA
eukprot:6909993-Prymnesium_polylepis.1